jgi:arylformamidase
MSESDQAAVAGVIAFTGRSELADPPAALREALRAVATELAKAGAGPHQLTEMTWSAPDPAAFHPSRRAIDLAYREVFYGFRPTLRFKQSDEKALVVTATATPPAPPDTRPVWRTYSAAELAHQYSPRTQVPNIGAMFAQWTRDGEAFRAQHLGLDLAYGREAAARLDLYRPAGVDKPPLWIFIHGGYWQSVTKEQTAQFAAGMLRSGYAVANIDHTLSPQMSLPQIVGQIRGGMNFLHREAESLAVNGARLHVAGHSAGAHLAAMMAADPDCAPVASVMLISGVFDLRPLALLPMGGILGLDDSAVVRRNSPINFRPRPGCRVGVAVGSLETDEFKRQSTDLASVWRAEPLLIVKDRNHFDILDGLIDGDLLKLATRIART